jgi:hypothetical protein
MTLKCARQLAGTIFAILAVAASSMLLAAQSNARIDVTGAWALEVVTDAAGTTTPSVTLKQDGTKLTGHYSSATLGEADVTGTLNGQAIAFSFTADVQGTSLQVSYTGTVESKDSMKGKISLGGLGEGTFTGKRK